MLTSINAACSITILTVFALAPRALTSSPACKTPVTTAGMAVTTAAMVTREEKSVVCWIRERIGMLMKAERGAMEEG
jgi:hypothetical protein